MFFSALAPAPRLIGIWRVWRQYRFDYSYDGVQRQRGFVIMLGKQLQAVVVPEEQPTLH